MKITDIKQQVKRKDRYSIYIDDKYIFSLSEAEFVSSGFRKGDSLSTKELENYKAKSEEGKAYDRMLRFISVRMRSRWEVEQYLKRKGYVDSLAKSLLVKAEKLGLINDEGFAKQWVEWRTNSGGRSKKKLSAELYQKKIDPEIINQVLSEIDEQTEIDQIKNVIARKSRLSQYQDKQKLVAFLARQGYSYYLIKRAVENE
jgi:regulatory protein